MIKDTLNRLLEYKTSSLVNTATEVVVTKNRRIIRILSSYIQVYLFYIFNVYAGSYL
jgi:hypothetical protein